MAITLLRLLLVAGTVCFAASSGMDLRDQRSGTLGFVSPMFRGTGSLGQPMGLRRSRNSPVSGLCMNSIDDLVGDFKEGDTVKVAKEITIYHAYPKEPEGLKLEVGKEGVVNKILVSKHPKATPNKPIVVQFTEPKKMFVHFECDEITKA